MKRFIAYFYLCTLLLYFFLSFSFLFEDIDLNPFDYARITDVDYKAVLVDEPESNGKVIITEKLTFDIHASSKNNPFWELWRDLPEDYVDGLKVGYKINSVYQILEDGTRVKYEESPKLYWEDYDYVNTNPKYGPGKWYHSEGPYNEYARQYECLLFYVDGLYRDEVVFEIEYEMTNAALRYKDASELYLCMYSGETVKHLKSFKGQILIPNKDMPHSGNYYAYTYGTNAHEFPFTESTSINPGYYTFLFNLDKSELKFKNYNQYIEFALISYEDDKHIFTNYAPDNNYSHTNYLYECDMAQQQYENLPIEARTKKVVVLLICLFISFIIIIITVKKYKKMRKKYTFYEPEIPYDYFREIPSNLDPNFASILVFSKHKMPKNTRNNYSAVMLSLVRKKYIELAKIDENKDWTNNNVKIIIKHKPVQYIDISVGSYSIKQQKYEPLTPSEAHYFNLIFKYAHGIEIPIKTLKSKILNDYENTNSFVKDVDNSMVNIGTSKGYFQKANYDEPKYKLKPLSIFYIVVGIILVTLVNFISYQTRLDLAFGGFTILGCILIISALYIRKLSNRSVLFTQFGEDEYYKWRGLYNFLNSDTLMKERTVIELPLWEQYLVYATAFGISKKVIKALKVRCPDIDMSPMLRNPYYRSTYFRSSSYSFRSATRSAVRTAHYNSRGGYGGGFRIRWWWPWRRRRPEVAINT